MTTRDFSIYNYMVGDWVICENLDINDKNKVTQSYKIQLSAKDFASYYNGNDEYVRYRPIPLSKEVLEKNGFTKYNVGHNAGGWTIMDEEYCSDIPFTLTDKDFDTKQGDYKWGPVEDDREESFVREIGRIKYVHELQHLLKLVGIDKEIEL